MRIARQVALGLVLLVSAHDMSGAQSPSGAGDPSRRGVVTGRDDGAPVLGALVVHERSGARVRADEQGVFAVRARTGDTIAVRALGFRETRTVVPAGAAAPLRVVLTPLPTLLPKFTTTVGQRVIRASESPRSIAIVSKEELAAAAAVSVNQLLRQLPGLQELPAAPSRSSISIRGFDDARVLVLVDGEPVSGTLVESRDIGRLSAVGTERIEVTKGPSSVEFGSDALGGVINIVRAAPTKALSGEWLARRGGLGRQESSGSISQTVGGVGYRIDGGWRQSDRVTGYDAAGSTFHRVYDLRTDVRVPLKGGWQARLDARGSQERQRFPVDASFNGFIDDRGGQAFVEGAGPTLGGLLRLRAAGQRFLYTYRQSRGMLPIRGSADSLEQRERVARYLASYTRVLGGHAIDAGVQHAERHLAAPGKLTGDSAAESVTEAFVRDAWTVGRWQLTAGARTTRSTLWGQSTNPSLGATWQATSRLQWRANVARGFRAPGFKEIRYTFTNPAAGYTLIGNTALRPERSVSTSVGGAWAVSSRLGLDVEAYRNDVRDLIDWRYQGDNAAGFQQYANVNVAEARTQGVEFNARLVVAGAEWTAGYDFLRARDLGSGLPLSRRATHTARLRASHEWRVREGLIGDLSARYTGGAPLIGIPSGAPITGPFSTESGVVGRQGALLSVDAQVRLAVTPVAELSGGVNNLLGQRPALWTPAFDRQFYVGASVKWSGVER